MGAVKKKLEFKRRVKLRQGVEFHEWITHGELEGPKFRLLMGLHEINYTGFILTRQSAMTDQLFTCVK